MARADRRSVRSARPHAAARAHARERAALEDTLFFTRLRRHAKWMFVFLALAFGVGFVVFGIGSDQGTGIGDILRNQGGSASGGPSVGEAREKLEENPRSAGARRALATALIEDGQTEEAATVLAEYVEQRPRDAEALSELAELHLTRATALARRAEQVQLRASYLTFGSAFTSPLQLGESGETLGTDAIQEAVTAQTSQEVNDAFVKAQSAYQQAEATYEKVAALRPRDPNVQFELAQVAQQSGDVAKAIAAYERFLELAPDDPNAEIVRQQIAQLKATQAPTASG